MFIEQDRFDDALARLRDSWIPIIHQRGKTFDVFQVGYCWNIVQMGVNEDESGKRAEQFEAEMQGPYTAFCEAINTYRSGLEVSEN